MGLPLAGLNEGLRRSRRRPRSKALPPASPEGMRPPFAYFERGIVPIVISTWV